MSHVMSTKNSSHHSSKLMKSKANFTLLCRVNRKSDTKNQSSNKMHFLIAQRFVVSNY